MTYNLIIYILTCVIHIKINSMWRYLCISKCELSSFIVLGIRMYNVQHYVYSKNLFIRLYNLMFRTRKENNSSFLFTCSKNIYFFGSFCKRLASKLRTAYCSRYKKTHNLSLISDLSIKLQKVPVQICANVKFMKLCCFHLLALWKSERVSRTCILYNWMPNWRKFFINVIHATSH